MEEKQPAAQRSHTSIEEPAHDSHYWRAECPVCGMVDGLPDRLHPNRTNRIKSLGNAVVPQIVELIARRILNRDIH